MMKLFSKTHKTEKIPTNKGNFLGLSEVKSIRNLEVGDYFIKLPEVNLLVFIQKEWQKVWFLNVIEEKIVGEIEYNVLTDKTNIIESTEDFTNMYNHELNQLKIQLK